MPRTSLETLTRRVVEYFRKHAAQYALDPEQVDAGYIFNWGGFVNVSYRITDGQKSLHLKLADDDESRARLLRWQALDPILSARYHAPHMLDWVRIPRTGFEGALFEFLPGRPADFANQPALLFDLLDLLVRLHADEELRAAILRLDGEPAGAQTCADYFLSVYIDRLDEDLLIIAGDLPPFVSLDLLSWMMGETRELEGLARDLPAFQCPATAPVHGDLWPSNILADEAGQFHIIDWDDLELGDAALDYSILLGSLWRDRAMSAEEVERLLPLAEADEPLRERFRVALRALLLDEVIDTLADWVEAAFVPEQVEETRAAKERTHRAALTRYMELYGEKEN
jgi:hypothetical protein